MLAEYWHTQTGRHPPYFDEPELVREDLVPLARRQLLVLLNDDGIRSWYVVPGFVVNYKARRAYGDHGVEMSDIKVLSRIQQRIVGNFLRLKGYKGRILFWDESLRAPPRMQH